MSQLTLQDLLDTGCATNNPELLARYIKLNGLTEFLPATEKGDLDKIKLLISHGFDIKLYEQEILNRVCRYGQLEILKYLVENGDDVKKCPSSLLTSVNYDYWEVAKYLIDNGIDLSTDESIVTVSHSGNLEMVKYLVEHNANIHVCNDLAVGYASENGHLEIVKYLMSKGANIHTRNEYAIRWAICYSHFDVVNYLLENGAIVTDDTFKNSTAEMQKIIKLYQNKEYYGICSETKLEFKLPDITEINKNNKYYYVYTCVTDGEGWTLPDLIIKYKILSSLEKGEPKHYRF